MLIQKNIVDKFEGHQVPHQIFMLCPRTQRNLHLSQFTVLFDPNMVSCAPLASRLQNLCSI